MNTGDPNPSGPAGLEESAPQPRSSAGSVTFFVILVFPLIVNPIYAGLKVFYGADLKAIFILRDLWLYLAILLLVLKGAARENVSLAALGWVALAVFGVFQQLFDTGRFQADQFYFLIRTASVFFLLACSKEIAELSGIRSNVARKVLAVFLCFSLLELVVEYRWPGLMHTFVYALPVYFEGKGVVANAANGLITQNRLVSTLYSPSQFGLFLGACFSALLLSWPKEMLVRRRWLAALASTVLLAVGSVGKLGLAMMALSVAFRRLSTGLCEFVVLGALALLLAVTTAAPMLGEGIHVASSLAHIDGLRSGLLSAIEHPLGLGVGAAGIVSTVGQDDADMPVGGESLIGATVANHGVVAILAVLLFARAARRGHALGLLSGRGALSAARYKFFLLFVVASALNENTSNPVVWIVGLFLLGQENVAERA